MEKKKNETPKSKLSVSERRILRNSVLELLGKALIEEKNPETKKETREVFLKDAINSRFLNN